MSRTDSGRNRKPYDRPRPSDGMWVHDKVQNIPRSVSNAALNGNVGRGPASVNTKLVVSNLHYNVTPKDLISIFGQIGTLTREPHIKYDRSGRSTGVAFITYETPTEATRAKKQFDGIEAKGQKMSVNYDSNHPGRVRRSSAPESLLDRIQKKPLLERLDVEGEKQPKTTNATTSDSGHGGPVRTRERNRRRGGAGGAAAPAGGRPPPSQKKGPKTAADLDNELDAFMREDATGGEGSVAGATAGSSSALADGDVDMA